MHSARLRSRADSVGHRGTNDRPDAERVVPGQPERVAHSHSDHRWQGHDRRSCHPPPFEPGTFTATAGVDVIESHPVLTAP